MAERCLYSAVNTRSVSWAQRDQVKRAAWRNPRARNSSRRVASVSSLCSASREGGDIGRLDQKSGVSRHLRE